jgi:hypothetical protein
MASTGSHRAPRASVSRWLIATAILVLVGLTVYLALDAIPSAKRPTLGPPSGAVPVASTTG